MKPSSSTSTDTTHLLTPAGPATVADLRRVNLDLDRQIFDLESLLKAGEALYEQLEVDGTCDLLMGICAERLRASPMAVLLRDDDEDGGALRVRASAGLDDDLTDLCIPTREGLLWTLLRAGDPFSVRAPGGRHRFPNLWDDQGLQRLDAELFVPLTMVDRVVGVLSLGRGADGSTPSAADHPFLRTLASQASVALNTARLYERLEVERKKQARSFHQLAILFDVTRKLAEVSDLTRMLRLVLKKAVGAVGAEKGSLMLVDEPSRRLVVRVVEGLKDAEVQRKINDGELACRRFALGEGVAGKVWETGRPVIVGDSRADPRFVNESGSYVRALMCMPLIVDDEVLGVLNVTNPLDGEFQEADASILGALADQAAVAIARARLYEAAITDGLTGLRVRRFGVHRFREEVKRSARYGEPLSIIMADIDLFKAINDNHGHPAGDDVLREVAAVILGAIRQGVDIAVRYGGEEFLLILPSTGLGGAAHLAERLRGAVDALTVAPEDEEIPVTLSMGVAELGRGESASALLGRADKALYRAKEGGRNTVVLSHLDGGGPAALDLVPPSHEAPSSATDLPPVQTDGDGFSSLLARSEAHADPESDR